MFPVISLELQMFSNSKYTDINKSKKTIALLNVVGVGILCHSDFDCFYSLCLSLNEFYKNTRLLFSHEEMCRYLPVTKLKLYACYQLYDSSFALAMILGIKATSVSHLILPCRKIY